MNRNKLVKILNRWNPWWVGRWPDTPKFKRLEFETLSTELSDKKISVVTGPRQTGKTTLLRQIILGLIDRNIKPQRILYLLLDDVADELESGELSLREILEVWSADIMMESLEAAQKYVFFDEVQLYEKWSLEMKSLSEQKLPIKFFVSGSSSVDILKGTSESLAGRILRTVIMPLSFTDILRFYIEDRELTDKIEALGRSSTNSLSHAVLNNRADSFFDSLQKLDRLIMPIENKIRINLNNYVQKGGYPEIILSRLDQFQCFARLKNYIDSVIHKDFVKFFKVRDTKTLERILKIVSKNTSQIISERNIAKDLGVSINTVRNHLGFLEDTFLVLNAELLTKSAAKKMRRPQKLYIVDVGLGNTLVGYDESDRGKISETIAHNHLEFLAINNPANRFSLSYWKDNHEIDIVLSIKDKNLPIEVKCSGDKVTKGMKYFIDKHKSWGLIVSDNLKKTGNVIFTPLYLLLLTK